MLEEGRWILEAVGVAVGVLQDGSNLEWVSVDDRGSVQ